MIYNKNSKLKVGLQYFVQCIVHCRDGLVWVNFATRLQLGIVIYNDDADNGMIALSN